MTLEMTLQGREGEEAFFVTSAGDTLRLPLAIVPEDWKNGQAAWLTLDNEQPRTVSPADILNEALRTDDTPHLA